MDHFGGSGPSGSSAPKSLGSQGKKLRLPSPLHQAAAQGHKQAVENLLGSGHDVHATDSAMSTPLQRAAAEGHLEVVTQLLRHGADVNRQDLIHGNSSLHEASWRGYSQTVNLLCKAGANPNVNNRAGFTPLHLACQNGHNQTTRFLLLAGALPDKQNSYGDTALHTAARYGHAGVTRILLSGKANINVQNKNGDTVLHIATAMGRRRLTRILLESGSDPLVKNKQEETALVIALRKDYKEVIALLQNPPPLRTREERWKDRRRKLDSRSRSKHSDERRKDRTDSGNSSRDSGSRHRRKRQKSTKSSEQQSVAWSPYGCHATPDLAEALTPKLENLPSDTLRDGEQYYLDLAGNIRKGPVGYTTACYCGPLLHRLECHLAKSKQEIVGHVDMSHEKLNHKIESLEKNTRRQLAGIQRTVDSLGLESSSVGLQRAVDKLEPRRHSNRKHAFDKKSRAHRSQHDLPRSSNDELTVYKIPPSNAENHYLEMYPARTKRDDIYITRADMQSTLDRLGLEGGRYEWNEGSVMDTNRNVTMVADRLRKINLRKDESSVVGRDKNRFVTEAIVHTENFGTSSSKLNDSRLSLSLSTETSSQSTFVSQKSKTKDLRKYEIDNQRASSDSGIGLMPQGSQDNMSLRYSMLVNNPPPTEHERELLKIIDQYQDYSSDESCESGLEDEVEEEPLDTSKEMTLPPPMSLSLTNAKKYTSHHNMHLHEIGTDYGFGYKDTKYGPDAKYGMSDMRILSPISEEKSKLSETYSTEHSLRFDPTVSIIDDDKHNDSGYSTRLGMSSEGTSPALSGLTLSSETDLREHPRPTYIDQTVGLPNPDQWNAHRRQLMHMTKLQTKLHHSELKTLTEISEASLV